MPLTLATRFIEKRQEVSLIQLYALNTDLLKTGEQLG